jgi:glycosyltransferase involved in cell wall biosynthesis
VAPVATPYVLRDAEILGRRHQVETLYCHRPMEHAQLLGAVRRNDVVLVWFAKLHALAAVELARLAGRPVIVVAAGDDVASLPGLGYGMFAHRRKAWCPRWVLRRAHAVVAVSRHARREARRHVQTADRWAVVYHGFDGERLAPLPGETRQQLVLTVSRVTRETLAVKGLRLLARTAALLPEVPFVLLGGGERQAEAELAGIAPPNLRCLGWQPQSEVVRWASRARVYLQPSETESFGAAVAEAMLCGAVPVVPRRGALPEVVGRAGVYARDLAPESLAAAVRQALALDGQASGIARQRILDRFPYARRERGLEQAIESAMYRARLGGPGGRQP